ncbi:MAG: HTTM domain-containing protein [Byssovorax sp.]
METTPDLSTSGGATPDEAGETATSGAAERAAAELDGAPGETAAAETSAPEEREVSWKELLRATYMTMDRRTLGFTRILLGAYLILDLFRRTSSWLDMFSNEGILPTHVSLFRPQSDNFTLFHAFSTAPELWVLWTIGLVTYVALLVGYKTKIAQIVSLLFVCSMNGRVLLIENGGYVIQNLLLLWTCFLPLGDRFSIDAMRASLRRRRESTVAELADRAAMDEPKEHEPFVTFTFAVILLQLSAIYYFNVIHKTGPAWKDGTAVHYVLYNDRMATPFVPLIRDHIPLLLVRFMTKATMAFEAGLPVVLLSPLAVPWARRTVVFMMCTLHLAFGTTFTLGPFAWACCIFSTLMFGKEDWDLSFSAMRRAHRARTVLLREGSGAALTIGRVLARIDRFELLTFKAEAGLPGLFAVVRPDGTKIEGGAALGDILATFPLGPLVAFVPKLPGLRSLFDALLAYLATPAGERWLEPGGGARFAAPGEPSPLARRLAKVRVGLREGLLLLMFAAAINQALVELWVARPLHAGQPEPFRSLSHKLRFLQGWFMFSPNPVMDDGIVVCDAETVDGRVIDPFSGKKPLHDLGGEVQYSQIWQDYMNRIQLPQNSYYRDALKAWILKYHERTGHPEDRIVAAKVVWAHDMNPRLGSTVSTNYEERELLSFDTRTNKSTNTP